MAPYRAEVGKFNGAQRRERVAASSYFNIIGVDRLGEGGSHGNGVQSARVALSPSRRTHHLFGHPVFDLARAMLQRDTQPSVIYCDFEDVENSRVELWERNHCALPPLWARGLANIVNI